MTATCYVIDVLQTTFLSNIDGGQNVLFQQDIEGPHNVRQTMDILQEKIVNVLLWPPRSADLNLIDHVWDMMGRLSTLHHPPQTPTVNSRSPS